MIKYRSIAGGGVKMQQLRRTLSSLLKINLSLNFTMVSKMEDIGAMSTLCCRLKIPSNTSQCCTQNMISFSFLTTHVAMMGSTKMN